MLLAKVAASIDTNRRAPAERRGFVTTFGVGSSTVPIPGSVSMRGRADTIGSVLPSSVGTAESVSHSASIEDVRARWTSSRRMQVWNGTRGWLSGDFGARDGDAISRFGMQLVLRDCFQCTPSARLGRTRNAGIGRLTFRK
jgi:hypothetical protein